MDRTVLAPLALICAVASAHAQPTVKPEEARAIAKEAFIYGYPLVDNYRVQYSYFVNKSDPEYKGGWNEIHNTARVYGPEDKAIQTPNSDTPYSFVGADLRTEPLVLTVPEVEQGRYYSLQFHRRLYVQLRLCRHRATGNSAASFLLAGPRWQGETPAGVKAVIRSETSSPSCSTEHSSSAPPTSRTSRRSNPATGSSRSRSSSAGRHP
jgi:hypothetical protein